MNFSEAPSRLVSVAALSVAAACLLVSTGCGGKSKAAAASSNAPQSLSEPVRASETEPAAPAIPVSNSDDYAVQKTGQSRELPTFIPPSSSQPPASAPAAVVQLDDRKSGDKYHTMSKGETLYAVSRKYNVKVKDIIAVNNFKDPNKLSVGTKVFIPN